MPRIRKTKKQDLHLEELASEPKIYKDDDILKCEIGKAFHDKYTDELYEVGKTYNFTYKRVKEIQEKNKEYLKIK